MYVIYNTLSQETMYFNDLELAISKILDPSHKRTIGYSDKEYEIRKRLRECGYYDDNGFGDILMDVFFEGSKNRIYNGYYKAIKPNTRKFNIKTLLDG